MVKLSYVNSSPAIGTCRKGVGKIASPNVIAGTLAATVKIQPLEVDLL